MEYTIKYTEEEVSVRIKAKVNELRQKGILNERTVYLVMLNGGAWFASKVFDTLGAVDNAVYYIKGHSYDGKEQGELVWDYMPLVDWDDKELVVLDDICDSGNTTRNIHNYLSKKAKKIAFLNLIIRKNKSNTQGATVYACIEDESDDFFVGCGMDDNDKGRLLPYIGVV